MYYQIFVPSFADSNGDGTGDLRGILQQLDYLQDLGMTGIWLSPLFRSPSYHKYDTLDYYSIDPSFGNMEDFEALVQGAKARNMDILLDLVFSHTSKDHPWFRSALENGPFRNFYLWKTPEEIRRLKLGQRQASADTGIRRPWHRAPGNTEKYYGIFSADMPDLNLENLETRIALLEIARFWLSKGVKGFRLDAAKHLYAAWLPEDRNIAFWSALKEELQKDYPDVFLLGEVWSTPDKIAPYYRGLHATFNFELCYGLRDALRLEKDLKNLLQNLAETRKRYCEVQKDFVDAIFLGNHDQERIASVFQGHRGKTEAALNLLLTLPGTPFLYYGEELGMQGKKPDIALREPFPWGTAMTTTWNPPRYATPQRLPDLQQQKEDPTSLYHHYRRMLHWRKEHPALQGDFEALAQTEPRLLAYIRTADAEKLLILQNLSTEVLRPELPFPVNHLILSTQRSTWTAQETCLQPFGMLVLHLT
jgi:alpha-amylase